MSHRIAEMPATLPLEEAVEFAATTHKHAAENPPEVIVNGHAHFDPRTAGGVLIVGSNVVTIRPPRWRAEEDNPTVTTADVMQVPGLTYAESVAYPDPLEGRVAHEVEGWVLNPETHDHLSVAKPTDEHPELIGSCIEEATVPTNDLYKAGILLFEAKRKLYQWAESEGGLFYPSANLAHRPLEESDINNHPYVLRIIRLLASTEAFLNFDGAALQSHIERVGTFESHVAAYHNLALVAGPIFAAAMASSPFYKGQIHPSLAKGGDGAYLATRYFSRQLGSPEAGLPIRVIPSNADHAAMMLDDRMRHAAPTPGRIAGHHTERLRIDLPPYGTSETAGKDSNGHIETNMAITAAERIYDTIIERAVMTGDIERLAKEYPLAVKARFDESDRLAAIANAELLAQQGLDATVQGMDGRSHNAREVRKQILRMCQQEAPPELRDVARHASKWIVLRTTTPKFEDMARDEHGLVTAHGYYNGQPGTLAHYMHARAKQLVDLGFSERDAIVNVQEDVMAADVAYMKTFRPEKNLAFLKHN